MGTCGNSEKKPYHDKQTPYDSEPADTESLKNVTLPTLAFYVLLSDIKIKKCNYVHFY
jgi:hypothetical protein